MATRLVKDHFHEVDSADLGDVPVIPGPGPQGEPGVDAEVTPAANVAAIADTSVADAEAVGDKVNAILAALKDAELMEADA